MRPRVDTESLISFTYDAGTCARKTDDAKPTQTPGMAAYMPQQGHLPPGVTHPMPLGYPLMPLPPPFTMAPLPPPIPMALAFHHPPPPPNAHHLPFMAPHPPPSAPLPPPLPMAPLAVPGRPSPLYPSADGPATNAAPPSQGQMQAQGQGHGQVQAQGQGQGHGQTQNERPTDKLAECLVTMHEMGFYEEMLDGMQVGVPPGKRLRVLCELCHSDAGVAANALLGGLHATGEAHRILQTGATQFTQGRRPPSAEEHDGWVLPSGGWPF